MAVISEIKCGRCDRRYSGFRSRCPYCGARRNKRGKHADETENAKAKLIIGIVLLFVLIAATMVLIITSLTDKADPEARASDSAAPGESSVITDPEALNTYLETSEEPGESEPPEESASPSIDANIQIASVAITYNGVAKTDVTMNVGETLKFGFETTPATTGKVAIWDETSNNTVISVSDGKVKALAKGTAKLMVTVDDVTATCIVRVKNR